ncbi:MAG: hypothetical protein ABIK15_04095 [Pseudomonadota bacterium]
MHLVRRRIAGFATAMILICLPVSILADSLPDEEISRRITFIQERLDQGTTTARRWQYSWMLINGGLSYLQFGMATTLDDKDEEHDRFDNIVGGITGLLGAGDLAVNPLVAWSAAERLRQLPDTTTDEKIAKLRQGEALLKACADREEYGRSWKTHALNGLVNLLAGVAIACDDNRKGDGALAFASGMLVSEIQIFTMPTRAISDWQEYSKRSSNGFTSRREPFRQNRFFITANSRQINCSILF